MNSIFIIVSRMFPSNINISTASITIPQVTSIPVGPWKLVASTSMTSVDQDLHFLPVADSTGGLTFDTVNHTGGWLIGGLHTLDVITPTKLLQKPYNELSNTIRAFGIHSSLIVAVGSDSILNGTIQTTTTGKILSTIISGPYTNTTNYTSVVYGSNLWAVGGNGTSTLTTSSDGNVWTPLTSPLGINSTINTLGYGSSLWVAGGIGISTVATSVDGIIWKPRTNPFNNDNWCTSVAYGNDRWVAGGGGNGNVLSSIAVSTDGLVWNPVSNPFMSTCTSVAYGNSIWIAGGIGISTIATSINGIVWNPITSPFGSNISCTSVAYSNNIWIATPPPGISQIATSVNGLDWKTLDIPTAGNSILTAAYADFLKLPVIPTLTIGSNTVSFTDKLMHYLRTKQ